MDEGAAINIALGVAALGVGYYLLKQFTKTLPGAAGGVGGLLTDVAIGARTEDTAITVTNPSKGTIQEYYGKPVLGFMVSPKVADSVSRQPFHGNYGLTFVLQNMTSTPVSGLVEIDVTEDALIGADTHSHAESGPHVLGAFERKQFTIQVDTATVFTMSSAVARIRFAGLDVINTTYVVK